MECEKYIFMIDEYINSFLKYHYVAELFERFVNIIRLLLLCGPTLLRWGKLTSEKRERFVMLFH